MHKTLNFLLLFVLASGHAQVCSDFEGPKLNNIGYVLSGYDVYFSNPLPTQNVNIGMFILCKRILRMLILQLIIN